MKTSSPDCVWAVDLIAAAWHWQRNKRQRKQAFVLSRCDLIVLPERVVPGQRHPNNAGAHEVVVKPLSEGGSLLPGITSKHKKEIKSTLVWDHLCPWHVSMGNVLIWALSVTSTCTLHVSHTPRPGPGAGTDGSSSLHCLWVQDRSLSGVMNGAGAADGVWSSVRNLWLGGGAAAWEEQEMLYRVWWGISRLPGVPQVGGGQRWTHTHTQHMFCYFQPNVTVMTFWCKNCLKVASFPFFHTVYSWTSQYFRCNVWE